MPVSDASGPDMPPTPVSTRWMWWGMVPIGFGAWVPLVAGIKAKKREWVTGGLLIIALTIVALIASEIEGDGSNWAGGLLVAAWIVQGVTSFALIKPYRRRMTVRAGYDERIEEVELLDEERRMVIEFARKDPERALAIGVGRPDIAGSRHGHVIDVNHAPAGVVASLPGVTNEIPQEIVRLRGELGGFESVDDLAALLDLHPRIVTAMRTRAVAL